jgi:hypothetical protein
MTIMQQLSHIVAARTQDVKPALRDSSQLTRVLTHPTLDRRIPSDRIVK